MNWNTMQDGRDIKPELTGIWQVYGRSGFPFDQAQFLDFRLMMKTVPVVLFGKGGVK